MSGFAGTADGPPGSGRKTGRTACVGLPDGLARQRHCFRTVAPPAAG